MATFERAIMKSTAHKNIHKCIDFFEDDQILILVTEAMICDARDLLREVGKPLNEDAARRIFKNLTSAV